MHVDSIFDLRSFHIKMFFFQFCLMVEPKASQAQEINQVKLNQEEKISRVKSRNKTE